MTLGEFQIPAFGRENYKKSSFSLFRLISSELMMFHILPRAVLHSALSAESGLSGYTDINAYCTPLVLVSPSPLSAKGGCLARGGSGDGVGIGLHSSELSCLEEMIVDICSTMTATTSVTTLGFIHR